MAFLEGGNEGALNGTTDVTVVAVPGSSTRRLVKNVHFCNRDTVTQTIILLKDKAATQYELARETLAPGEYWTFDKIVVLDDTDESLIAKQVAAVTTTAPSYDSAHADAS